MQNVRRIVLGRSGEIRTHDPCLPKTVLYQAELHSDRAGRIRPLRRWLQEGLSAGRACFASTTAPQIWGTWPFLAGFAIAGPGG